MKSIKNAFVEFGRLINRDKVLKLEPSYAKIINTRGCMADDESDFRIGKIVGYTNTKPVNASANENWTCVVLEFSDGTTHEYPWTVQSYDSTRKFFFIEERDDMPTYRI